MADRPQSVSGQVLDSFSQYRDERRQAAELLQEALADVAQGVAFMPEGVLIAEGPILMGFRPEEDTPEAKERYQKFAQDYYSGDATRRKPHLDRIFDSLEQLEIGFDPADPDEMLRNAADFVRKADRGCCINRLLTRNADYVRDRYREEPVKLQQLKNKGSLFEAALMMEQSLMLRQERYLDGSSIDPTRFHPKAEDRYGTLDTLQSKIQMASGLGENAVCAMQGQPTKPIVVKAPTVGSYNPCNIQRATHKGEAVGVATGMFQTMFAHLMEHRDNGYISADPMDLLFINGKSAKELYGDRYKKLPTTERRERIWADTLGAMGSGRNHIEMATVQRDEQGEPRVVVQSLKMDLAAVQPDKKDEYSWIRRHLFDWGPARCKTRQERQDALEAKDTDREARQKAIEDKLRQVVDDNRQGQAAQEENEIYNRKREQCRSIEKYNPLEMQTLRSRYEMQLFGHMGIDDNAKQKQFEDYERTTGMRTLNRGISRQSMANLMMLVGGSTMQQIVLDDSPETMLARAEAGKQLTDMLERNNVEEMADFYLKAGQKLSEQKLPMIEVDNPKKLAKVLPILGELATIAKDYEQTMPKSVLEWLKENADQKQFADISTGTSMVQVVGVAAKEYLGFIADPQRGMIKERPDEGLMGRAIAGKKLLEEYGSLAQGKTVGQLASVIPTEELLAKNGEYLQAACLGVTRYPVLQKEGMQYLLGVKPLQIEPKDASCYRVNGISVQVATVSRSQIVNSDMEGRTRVDRKALDAQERTKVQQKAGITQPEREAKKAPQKQAEGPAL